MFGKNWEGPWKSIIAYANYFRRGSQQGEHSEAWYYYLHLLFAYRPSKRIFWSEGLIAVLAVIGGIYSLALRRKSDAEVAATLSLRLRVSASPLLPFPPSPLLRFLTFYTLILTLLYSLVRYKTPWCALSFLMGMILLAGVGAAAIFRFLPNRTLRLMAAILLAAGAAHLGWQAYQLSFNPRYIADPRNPYVYAHTPMPLPKLAARLDRLAGRVPGGRDIWIQVVVPENYWPLPWYLRKFNEARVCYWLDAKQWKEEMGRWPAPAILILSGEVDCDDVAARLAGYSGPAHESLRPWVPIAIYVRSDLWAAYLECQNENAGS